LTFDLRPFIVAIVLSCVASTAFAHPAPFSYLDLRIQPNAVSGSIVLHVIDVAHDLAIDPADRLMDPAVAVAAQDRIAALLVSRLHILADGRELTPAWGGIEPLPDRQGVRLAFQVSIPRPATLTVRARVFPYDPNHQTFMNVYEDDQLRQQAIFGGNDDERVYYAGTVQGALAVVRTFVPAGIHHILIGPDHILFLVGLLLLGGGSWSLLRIVTAFTVGHSVTLSLAALGILTPPARIIDPAIALSIIFVGADNLLVGERGRDVRPWIALAFGFVHGFGFANILRQFGLPREALGWSLFSFNVGVEIGQLLIVAAIAGALAVVWRRNRAVGHRVAYAGSILVIVAGAYWFVERVFFRVA
jgi:hypothetical protein